MRALLFVTTIVATTLSFGSPSAPVGAAVEGSVFEAVQPCRLVDSRLNGGQPVSGTIEVDTTDCLKDVPGQVVAASVTATIVAPHQHGHLTLWSNGDKPTVSTLNWAPGEIRANSAVVELRSGKFFAAPATPAHLVIDVNAVFVKNTGASGGRFVAVSPDRVLDSRDSNGRQKTRTITFDMIPQGARGVVATFTTTQTTGAGFVSVWAQGERPLTSVLNVDGLNQTRASTVMVGVSAERTVNVYASSAEHLIVDVVGYFTADSAAVSSNGLFVPAPPKRLLDTRLAQVPVWRGGTVTGNDVGAAAGTLIANVTSVNPVAEGWMHIGGAQRVATPVVSSLNFQSSSTVANAAVVPLSTAGWALHSMATSHAVVDSFGYFTGPRTQAIGSIAHVNKSSWNPTSCISGPSRTNVNGHAEANPGQYQRVVSVPEVGRRGAVAVVGDSLTYQSARGLAVELAGDGWGPICIDGTISRTVEYGNSSVPDGLDAVRRIRQVSSEWNRSDVTWIAALGTNDAGFSTTSSSRANMSAAKLVDEIAHRSNIYWVNTKTRTGGSRPSYEAAWNTGVGQLGLKIIDWRSAVQANPGVLGGDKVHLSSSGIAVRNDLIVRSVA